MNAPLTPSAFEPRGRRPPPFRWPALRLWSVRHSALMERVYYTLEPIFVAMAWDPEVMIRDHPTALNKSHADSFSIYHAIAVLFLCPRRSHS